MASLTFFALLVFGNIALSCASDKAELDCPRAWKLNRTEIFSCYVPVADFSADACLFFPDIVSLQLTPDIHDWEPPYTVRTIRNITGSCDGQSREESRCLLVENGTRFELQFTVKLGGSHHGQYFQCRPACTDQSFSNPFALGSTAVALSCGPVDLCMPSACTSSTAPRPTECDITTSDASCKAYTTPATESDITT